MIVKKHSTVIEGVEKLAQWMDGYRWFRKYLSLTSGREKSGQAIARRLSRRRRIRSKYGTIGTVQSKPFSCWI